NSFKEGGSTFKTMGQENTLLGSLVISAPASLYSRSLNLAPSPALLSISTRWPCAVMAATASGVRHTRFSWYEVSLGRPMNKEPLERAISSISSWGNSSAWLKGVLGWFMIVADYS